MKNLVLNIICYYVISSSFFYTIWGSVQHEPTLDAIVPLHFSCLEPTMDINPTNFHIFKSLTIQSGYELTNCSNSLGHLYIKVSTNITIYGSIQLNGNGLLIDTTDTNFWLNRLGFNSPNSVSLYSSNTHQINQYVDCGNLMITETIPNSSFLKNWNHFYDGNCGRSLNSDNDSMGQAKGGFGGTWLNKGQNGFQGIDTPTGSEGGNPGSMLYLEASTIYIDSQAAILSEGEKGQHSNNTNFGGGGGGGSGGAIYLQASTIENHGIISVKGGAGGKGGGAQGGEGGFIDANGTSISAQSPEVNMNNYGGGGGGHGYDGIIVMLGEHIMNNGKLHASFYREGEVLSNIFSNQSFMSNVNSTSAKSVSTSNIHPPSVHGFRIHDNISADTEYVATWLNLKGVLKIYNEINSPSLPYWFSFQNILGGANNSIDTFKILGFSKLQYHFETTCNNNVLQVREPASYLLNHLGEEFNGTSFFNDTNNFRITHQTGVVTGNSQIKPFQLCDGINTLALNFHTTSSSPHYHTEQTTILVDQHAPCDSTQDSCTIQFVENDLNHTLYNQLLLGASSTGKLKIRINIVEEAGSNIENNPILLEPNLMLFAVQQTGNTLHEVGNPHVIYNFNSSSYLDKNCKELQLENKLPPMLYEGNYSLTNGVMEVNTAFNHDGLIWIFACTRDLAKNWSLFIHPQNSAIIIPDSTEYQGSRSLNYFSHYNPRSFDFNYPTQNNIQVLQTVAPSFYKRILIDTPSADLSHCVGDPCSVDDLIPSFIETSETTPKIAYTPTGYTNASQILVGVKLPYDHAGIKGLYYKISNTSPNQSDKFQNFVSFNQASIDKCEPLININNMEDSNHRVFNHVSGNNIPNNWVDLCFLVNPQAEANIYIWLEDYAGNNNFSTGMVSRKLFIDHVLPSTPTEFKSPSNPTLSTAPNFVFKTSQDNFGIESYTICFWQTWEDFSYNDLIQLPNGECPTSTLLNGRIAYKSQPVLHTNTEFITYQIPQDKLLQEGDWSFSIQAKDQSGNYSNRLIPVYHLKVSSEHSFLDFSQTHLDLKEGGVTPRKGTTGIYHFEVVYTNSKELAPNFHQVWIDENGNGVYDETEKWNLTLNSNTNNNIFADGEVYFLDHKITYNDSLNGKLKYKFYFESDYIPSQDGYQSGNPLEEHSIMMDPFKNDNFAKQMQVRNNIMRGSSSKAVIVLKPPQNPQSKIQVLVYTKNGVLVHTLVSNTTYNENLHRYVYWDGKDHNGRKVPMGVYRILYIYDNKKLFSSVMILK